MRHGESLASKAGLIISTPERGISGYGLTPEGKEEVRHALVHIRDEVGEKPIHIYTSDFARARETAEIAADVLGSDGVTESSALRERNFGSFENTSNDNYEKVWAADARDHRHEEGGVESVESVQARVAHLIDELETKYNNEAILLVSHGDTLHVLQACLEGIPVSSYRGAAPFATAEIRRIPKA